MSTISITRRLKISFDGREKLCSSGTNALRLVNGTGDGLPGIILEDYAGRWLISTQAPTLSKTLIDWLSEQNHPVYRKLLSRNRKAPPSHLCGSLVSEPFHILENGLLYEVSFRSGYSQGIFLDQRENRLLVRSKALPGQLILNTFAYTGAFSVCAAIGGATTTTLDLSQPYLNWAKRNFLANGLEPTQHYFCKGDTFHWLQRFAKQGRRFHGIILDPPTFSRDHKGRIFRVTKNYTTLASLAHAVLEPGGWLLCCANAHELPSNDFREMVRQALPRSAKLRQLAMPSDFPASNYLKSLWVDCP